jgi:phosphotransferase system IIA component
MDDESLQEPLSLISPKRWAVLFSFLFFALIVLAWAFFGEISVEVQGQGIVLNPGSIFSIASPVDGKIDRLFVKRGDTVLAGNLVMEMTDSTEFLRADREGVVFKISAQDGDSVRLGQNIVWLEGSPLSGQTMQVAGPLSLKTAEKIKVGMDAEVSIAGIDVKQYGKLKGKVSGVAPLWTNAMKNLFPNAKDPSDQLIAIDLIPDPTAPSGYQWSFGKGPAFPIEAGVQAEFFITLEKRKPINYLFP